MILNHVDVSLDIGRESADPRSVPGIDVFDAQFNKVTLAGNFTDPRLPAGFAPYNIQNINGQLFVTYLTTASGVG